MTNAKIDENKKFKVYRFFIAYMRERERERERERQRQRERERESERAREREKIVRSL